MLAELCETCVREHYALNIVSALQGYAARLMAERGDFDVAVAQARTALDELFSSSNFFNCIGGTNTLVEALLARGTEADLDEAEVAIERLASTLSGSAWVTRDIYVLRLRALMARARGDEAAYRELRDRYREMANDLGFEGHMEWAAAMP